MKSQISNLKSQISNRGLSLTEVMISTALIAIALLALIQLGSVALRTSDAGRSLAIANQLNDEVLEAARANRDRSVDMGCGASGLIFECSGFWTYDGGVFTLTSETGFSGAPNPPPLGSEPTWGLVSGYSTFYRQVQFTSDGTGNKVEVTARVYYLENGRWPAVTSTTILTKWK